MLQTVNFILVRLHALPGFITEFPELIPTLLRAMQTVFEHARVVAPGLVVLDVRFESTARLALICSVSSSNRACTAACRACLRWATPMGT